MAQGPSDPRKAPRKPAKCRYRFRVAFRRQHSFEMEVEIDSKCFQKMFPEMQAHCWCHLFSKIDQLLERPSKHAFHIIGVTQIMKSLSCQSHMQMFQKRKNQTPTKIGTTPIRNAFQNRYNKCMVGWLIFNRCCLQTSKPNRSSRDRNGIVCRRMHNYALPSFWALALCARSLLSTSCL